MRHISIVAAAVIAVAATAPHLAAQHDAAHYEPVLGEWEMTMETQRGTFTTQFIFMLDGHTLKGESVSQMGTTALASVSFEDGKLTFEVHRTRGDRTFSQTYTAKIEGDTMTGMISSNRGEREFTATRKAT